MDFTLQAISCNGCASLLLITLLLSYRRQHGMKNQESRLFIRMILINLIQCIVETITVLIDGKQFPGAVTMAIVCNAFLYMNTILFSLSWALYAEEKVRTHERKKSLWDWLKYLPAAAIIVCAGANLFIPVFFRISQDNVYQRLGAFLLAYAATYFYLLSGSVTIFLHREQKEKSVFLPALTFLFPVCVASIIQFLVPGISLLWSGSAIGLASAYMNIQDESAFTDELSGLFSRHYLNRYLSTLPERPKDALLTLGILLDVDDFKSINDSFGHLMGDDAISAVGSILKAAIPGNRLIFRYAGDEFVVIMSIGDPAEAVPVLERIREETERFNQTAGKPYRLGLSTGFTTYIPGENPNAFLDRMDSRMYENKRTGKSGPQPPSM